MVTANGSCSVSSRWRLCEDIRRMFVKVPWVSNDSKVRRQSEGDLIEIDTQREPLRDHQNSAPLFP
jgi:hypothetical protein